MYKTMYKTILSGTLLMAASAALQAAPAVFNNGSLNIPEAAVIANQGNSYFTDVTLGFGPDGNIRVTGATLNHLVNVDSVETLIMESFPLQVSLTVSGNLSVPCKELLDPAVSFQDSTFTVVLAESNLGPAESCIAVIEPFETTIPLDVEGLDAGTYSVNVNGVTTEFTFDSDNG